MSSKQKHWGVNGVTRSGIKEHPHERGATHGAIKVPYQDQVDLLPGETVQVLTEKVCDICGTRYYRASCPLSGSAMHTAFAKLYSRKP